MSKSKKRFRVRTVDSREVIELFPVFEVITNTTGETSAGVPTASEKDVECKFIEIVYGKKVLKFNFLDFFTFIYFCANEELRQQLHMRYERVVHNLPYNVTFKLDDEEKRTGIARRRIELPVDEVTMAILKNEAMLQKGMKVKPNMPIINTPSGPKITSKLPKVE